MSEIIPEVPPGEGEGINPEAAGEEENVSGLVDAVESSKEAASTAKYDSETISDVLEAVNEGDPSKLDGQAKEAFDEVFKPGISDVIGKLNKLVPDLDLDPDASLKDNMAKGKNAKTVKNVFKQIADGLKKAFGEDTDEGVQEKLAKNEESASDTKEAEKAGWLKRNWKTIASIAYGAGEIAAVVAGLLALAQNESGCFEVHEGDSKKLSCSKSGSTLATACDCTNLESDETTGIPKGLSGMCVVTPSHKCPDYEYMYKHVSFWDALGQVVGDGISIVEGASKGLDGLINFIKKYGLYFAIGIAILVALGLITVIVKKL